ncbi:ETS homologous factor-like [Macrobrachium rosenbergii]|uniref:ETS homologous factor-like n=1 Tax=Macrobrachium rosenbergii TaxID=79674 RepID=UPI0034D48501
MDSCSHEDLNASFSFEGPLFSGDNTIDQLCQTYLGSLGSYAESHPQIGSGDIGLLSATNDDYDRKDVAYWMPQDCLDWAGSVCRKRGIDQSTVDLWALKSYSGSDLLQFTPQDFSNIVGSVYGPLFHQELTVLFNKREQDKMQGAVGGCVPTYGSYEYPTQEYGYESDPWELTSEDIKDLDRYIHHQEDGPLAGSLSDLDFQEQFLPIQLEGSQLIPEPVLQSSYGASPSLGQDQVPLKQAETKKKARGPKNWEFVIGLLGDPRTNPSLIRWEDKAQGTFRLVQPTAIAQMWGRRTNKPNLTYDNFARGLRYHYTTGALQAVSEKQLVYKCGPKALKFLIDMKKEGVQ